VLEPDMSFQPCILFAGKIRSLLYSKVPERYFTWVVSVLTHNYKTRLENIPRLKHSNVYSPFISYEKKYYDIVTSTNFLMCLKAFSPANGGARPGAMLRASGQLTAWPAYIRFTRQVQFLQKWPNI
jgi:hypothetical protein